MDTIVSFTPSLEAWRLAARSYVRTGGLASANAIHSKARYLIGNLIGRGGLESSGEWTYATLDQ